MDDGSEHAGNTTVLTPVAQAVSRERPYGIREYRSAGRFKGWQVSMRRQGVQIDRIFPIHRHGSSEAALSAAIAFRDEVNGGMLPMSKQVYCATLRSNNTSGVPGVRRVRDRTGEHWKASIHILDGPQKSRQFSIAKYGEEGAYRHAVEARRQLLEQVSGNLARHPEARRRQRGEDAEAAVEVVRPPLKDEPAANPFPVERLCDVPGVELTHVKNRPNKRGERKVTSYWTAVIRGADGLPTRRYFSIKRYGDAEAKRMAIEQRLAWERKAGG